MLILFFFFAAVSADAPAFCPNRAKFLPPSLRNADAFRYIPIIAPKSGFVNHVLEDLKTYFSRDGPRLKISRSERDADA